MRTDATVGVELSWGEGSDEKLEQHLKELSDEDAAAVTHLLVQRNGAQLTRLPAAVGRLTGLRLLDASHNALAAVPRELGRLEHLHTLYLQGNALSALPAELAAAPALEVLWLEENPALGDAQRNIGRPFHEDRAAVQALLRQQK